MKTIYNSVLVALLAAIAQTAPTPVPQAACNPNPHGRSCTVILNGAAAQSLSVVIPDPNYNGVSFNSGFSVSSITNPDTDNYFVIDVESASGATTTASDGQTVAVGTPQPLVYAFCQIVCPE